MDEHDDFFAMGGPRCRCTIVPVEEPEAIAESFDRTLDEIRALPET